MSEGKRTGGRGSVEAAARPSERRKRTIPVAKERRNQKSPTTAAVKPGDPTPDAVEFMKAMDQYKRDNRRPFPTWSEVLEVLRALGYRKVRAPSELPHYGAPPATPKG
jgi:hypothetical protein